MWANLSTSNEICWKKWLMDKGRDLQTQPTETDTASVWRAVQYMRVNSALYKFHLPWRPNSFFSSLLFLDFLQKQTKNRALNYIAFFTSFQKSTKWKRPLKGQGAMGGMSCPGCFPLKMNMKAMQPSGKSKNPWITLASVAMVIQQKQSLLFFIIIASIRTDTLRCAWFMLRAHTHLRVDRKTVVKITGSIGVKHGRWCCVFIQD